MASMRGKRLKYLRNHITILEMTHEFDKRLKNVENDSEIWEMAKIFIKWLRYMGHGLCI